MLPSIPTTEEVNWFVVVVADAADEDSDDDSDSSGSSFSSSTESNESGEEDKSEDSEKSDDDDSDNCESSSSDEDLTPPSGPINLIMGGLPIQPQSRWQIVTDCFRNRFVIVYQHPKVVFDWVVRVINLLQTIVRKLCCLFTNHGENKTALVELSPL